MYTFSCLFDIFSSMSLKQLNLSKLSSWFHPKDFPSHSPVFKSKWHHHPSVMCVRNANTILDFSFLFINLSHNQHIRYMSLLPKYIRYMSLLPKHVFFPLLPPTTLTGTPLFLTVLQNCLLYISCILLLPSVGSPCNN